MGQNNNSPTEDFLNKLLHLIMDSAWIVFSLLTLFNMNVSGYTIVILLHSSFIPEFDPLFYLLIEFIRLTLSGLLFFKIFHRPDSRLPFPSKEIRHNLGESFDMWFWFSGLTAIRTLLLNIYLKLDGLLNTTDDSDIYLQIGISVIFFVYLFVRLIRTRARSQDQGEFFDALQETRGFQSKAWEKLTSKLKDTEIRELAQSVYEDNQIGRINTINLLKVLWMIIFGSIMHELLQELFARF